MSFDHLNDEQFANFLAGDSSDPRARLHVESCTACRTELTSLGAAMGDLDIASLRWAERRAARIGVPSGWALHWTALPGWGATLAGVLIFGVALGAHMQNNDSRTVALQPTHAITAPSEDELAQDNRLMRSIDSEINDQVRPQIPVTELDSDTRVAHRRVIREVSN
ncbi:MAG TPA: hypothetical protein VGM11_07075 [Acidobacteriaceae bacterium]|jgi:hypothetical protein